MQSPPSPFKKYVFLGAKMGLFPLIFYFFFFCLLTYPLILYFFTHFFFNNGRDGLQNAYGLWWVGKAITQLHQSPWHTSFIFYPYGISLRGTSPALFNGVLTIFLSKFFTLPQTYNIILIFSFVTGGFTTFLLAYTITKSYWPSLIAGFIFTFSSYHFAHAAVGQLNLASLEWIPLFILLWRALMIKPNIPVGAAAAFALCAVFLCDYYYFFICVLSACLMFLWFTIQKRDVFFFLRKTYRTPLFVFALTSLLTAGVPLFALIQENIQDPFVSDCGRKICHLINGFSMNLLGPFIYGGYWRFGHLTEFYWTTLPCNFFETSVHWGWSVIFVIIFVWLERNHIQTKDLGLWYLIAGVFTVLALGPILHIAGNEFPHITLPYAWLQNTCPLLNLGRTPARLIVMAILSVSVLCAIGFKMLLSGSRARQWLAVALLIILFFETLPRFVNNPYFGMTTPPYVRALKNLPGKEAVIDLVTDGGPFMYYQIIHERPLAFGDISHCPLSVHKKNQELSRVLGEKNFSSLFHDYHFRYLVTKDTFPSSHPAVVFRDGDTKIYDLSTAEKS